MSRRGRGLTEDERRLWRHVAAGLKTRRPLAKDEEAAPPRAKSSIAPQKERTPAPQPGARTPAPPQDRSGEKRVRRGRLDVDATLDLHGHNQATGRAALGRFLRRTQARGARTVIVITGSGRGGQGVFKRCLPDWLGEPDLRALVSGFAQAHRDHGGAGAVYVFLRRTNAT